jgi:hypothetical protein
VLLSAVSEYFSKAQRALLGNAELGMESYSGVSSIFVIMMVTVITNVNYSCTYPLFRIFDIMIYHANSSSQNSGLLHIRIDARS